MTLLRHAKRLKVFLVAFTLLLVGLFLFQNCSNVNISRTPSLVPIEPYIVPADKPQKIFCSEKGSTFGNPLKITFILDMSASNIGFIDASPAGFCGGKSLYSMINWDPDYPPSDLSGRRFNAVENFLNQCGSNPNIKYSIYGFSKNATFGTNESCQSPFVDKTAALASLAGLRNIQTTDPAKGGCSESPPFIMKDRTSYDSALKCLDNKMTVDSNLEFNDKPYYYTFFLTDGDPVEDSPSITNSTYINLLTSITNSVRPLSSGFKLVPVYYGNLPESKRGLAIATLDSLAHVTDPTINTAIISDFSNAAGSWCNKLTPPIQVNYTLKKMYAVNLNLINSKGKILADSDGDGISDSDEVKLGLDPLNPRTYGILDSLCLRSGLALNTCASLAGTCSNLSAGFGLTDCDLNAAKTIFGKSLTGFDTDSDFIPDRIEIMKGLNPVTADAEKDNDNDQISNIDEIIFGTDLQSSEKTNPTPLLFKTIFNVQEVDSANCSADKTSYEYILEQVALADTQAFTDSVASAVSTTHLAKENIILVFSIWEGLGSKTVPYRLMVEKLKMKQGSETKVEPAIFVGEITP